MPSRLKKQLVSSAIPFILLIFILTALPIVEPFLKTYILQFSQDQMGQKMAADTLDNFLKLAKILLWMALVITVVRFINSLIFSTALRGNQTSSLLRNVFSITICIVAFFVIFKSQYPEVDLAALFTTSAILGVILGLALQDTLGNLFAGLSLQADQPFAVGDVVNIPNKGTGIIESVTWRGVKIRTFQNKLLIISNSSFGKEPIEVAPRDNLNARIVFFSTLYTDSPTKTMHVVREAVREAENVSSKLKPIVRIRNFSENGIDWEVKYWLEDYARYNDTDALIRQRIWYAFLREGISFPFPTRTLYVKRRQPKAKQESEDFKVFERLSAVEIFEPLSDEETMRLANQTVKRVYAPGEIIIHAGDAGNTMFVIDRGSVHVQVPDDNGNLQSLATLHEGRFFGEMALFTGEPRTATITAAEETEVFEIGHDAVCSLLKDNPYLVEALSNAIAERQALLNATAENKPEKIEEERAGIFAAIKHFFRLN